MKSISSILFRGTQAQARKKIKTTSQTQGLCIVNFLYFAQAMKFKVYEDSVIARDEAIHTKGRSQDLDCHDPQSNLNNSADLAMTRQNYITALQNSDIICIDGIAMQIFDRVGQFFFGGKRPWTENLNGTDFLPYILEQTREQKVAIIMSTVYDPKINKGPEWMDKGLDKLQQLYPHIDIIFKHQTLFQHRGKDFPLQDCLNIINKERNKYDHILFLNGIGGPAQEIWTEEHKQQFKDTGIIIMNNGATLDYYSGFETRAPRRVVKLRIGETLRRVVTQPEKNLKKFLSMFAIVSYWGYLIKNFFTKSKKH